MTAEPGNSNMHLGTGWPGGGRDGGSERARFLTGPPHLMPQHPQGGLGFPPCSASVSEGRSGGRAGAQGGTSQSETSVT